MCSGRDLLKYFWYVYVSWILSYLLKITKYIGNTNLWILLFTSKISRWKRTELGHTLSLTPDFEKRLYICQSRQSNKDHEFLEKTALYKLAYRLHMPIPCVQDKVCCTDEVFHFASRDLYRITCAFLHYIFHYKGASGPETLPFLSLSHNLWTKIFTAYRPHSHLRYATAT